MAAAARRSGHEIRLDAQPTTVHGAPADLARAINNLLQNALKWSPEDSPIDVTVRAGTVTVRDRGPGINPEDAPHIFDRFYRAANARTQPGSGLGLAIVRQVTEAHRGTASMRAAPGGGSTFTIELPTREDQARSNTPLNPPTLHSTRPRHCQPPAAAQKGDWRDVTPTSGPGSLTSGISAADAV